MQVENKYTDRHIGSKLLEMGLSKRAARISWVYDPLNSRYELSRLSVEALELTGATGAIPALDVAEMAVVLKGNLPYYISIWEEWGYKSLSEGKGVGFETLASACGHRLLDMIKANKLTIEEINEALV